MDQVVEEMDQVKQVEVQVTQVTLLNRTLVVAVVDTVVDMVEVDRVVQEL